MSAPPDGLPVTIRLSFPPQPRLLGAVRLVVGIVARKAGIDDEGIEDLKVAASETCAVAVNDLLRAGLDEPIELELVDDHERFGVEVRDHAPALDPGDPDAGRLDAEVDDRQFGLALVGALVDDLHTEALPDGGHSTRFWLRKQVDRLPPPLT